MVVCFSISKAQTTFTANVLQADSVKSGISRSDSLCTGTLRVADSLCTGGDIRAGSDVRVAGDLLFSGANMGFRAAVIPTQTHISVLSIANSTSLSSTDITLPFEQCPSASLYTANATFLSTYGGYIARFSNTVQGTDQSISIYQSPWGQAVIESEGIFNNQSVPYGQNPLLINYFCNNDVAIGTGSVHSNGKFSRVFVGRFLQAGRHVEIGDSVNGIQNDNTNIGLLIHTHSGSGLKVRTYNPGLNAISVQHSGSQAPNNFSGLHTFYVKGNGETGIVTHTSSAALTIRSFTGSSTATPTTFIVYGDGRTYIGNARPLSNGVHKDAMLSVDGKVIAKKFYVTVKPGVWGDYVFEPNYPLKKLEDLKKYIHTNKHLPEIPSAREVEEKGLDMGEFNTKLLIRLEEAYLYIFQLEERIRILEDKLKK